MTIDELRAWAACPPTKTPQALSVSEAVADLFKAFDKLVAQAKRHANEFPALAGMRERLSIAEAHNAALQTELARVRALTMPKDPWDETEAAK